MMESWTDGRVPLDKSEGTVKDKPILAVFSTPLVSPERLRTKALEHHAAITSRWRIVPPTIDTALNISHDSSMRTSRLYGMRERPINPSV
jgi:hypothetical protein